MELCTNRTCRKPGLGGSFGNTYVMSQATSSVLDSSYGGAIIGVKVRTHLMTFKQHTSITITDSITISCIC